MERDNDIKARMLFDSTARDAQEFQYIKTKIEVEDEALSCKAVWD